MPMTRRDWLRSSLAAGVTWATPTLSMNAGRTKQPLTGAITPVHDPCIIREDDNYYIFSTGWLDSPTGALPWRRSKDLVSWESTGSVFASIPQWAQQAIPGMPGIWAPDISFFSGQYHLYYSCSTVGSNRSAIGLATNETLDARSSRYEWKDQGCVLMSQPGDDFNAIDPNHVRDRDGNHWLCFGSFWGGIKMVSIDPASGKPNAAQKQMYSLATRPVPAGAPSAIEAPFIIERQGYYYLFVSFDYCCSFERSNYYMVVGRSADIRGPYVGRDGKPMLGGFGTALLRGDRRYRGPGHCAVLADGDHYYLVHHAYDVELKGEPVLRIEALSWTSDGWPEVAKDEARNGPARS